MHTKFYKQQGSALVTALIIIAVLAIMSAGVILLVNREISMARRHYESTKAFFLAEAGIERAAATIMSSGSVGAIPSSFKLSDTGLDEDDEQLDEADISITGYGLGGNIFQVTATATVENSTRKIIANIKYNPQAKVFDYGYFLNNWGWFFGSGITANGDVRSNGRFDFNGNPTVEGEVYASEEIGGQDLVRGKAGTEIDGEYIYQHPNSPKVDMPNLEDLDYYKNIASSKGSSITIGGEVVINGVYGDDADETGNIVLIGTETTPIVVDGPVVITGDVIIKGVVTGEGTIYAGRNLYVADNISYADPPATPRPSSDNPQVVEQWVNDNKEKDIIGFTASENIIMGDYSNGDWQWLYNNYLSGMGSEDVGKDGIPDTGDEFENDGTFQSQYEDLDEDGNFDDDYQWSDVQTQVDIDSFARCPQGVSSIGDIATNNISKMEGIYYTNHACAGWGNGLVFNGSVISKDESMAVYNSVTFNYDERVHSRYTSDPNWLIDLNLPFSDRIDIVGWWEEVSTQQ